jgi:hypothetical protein
MQLAEGYQLKNIIEGCVEIEQIAAILSLLSVRFIDMVSTFDHLHPKD